MQESMLERNIIITEPSRNLRALGRNAMKGKWQIGIIAVCVYLICAQLPPLVFDSLFGYNLGNVVIENGNTYGMDVDFYSQMYNNMPQTSILSTLYILIISGPLELGVMIFFLAAFRRYDVHVTDVFLGFENFGKALGLFLYQMLFIFLWTLLFIIPGIIAAIRYSQAFYILADDPTKSVKQCMNESKAMMYGNKSKYFWLSMSFIGWSMLASLPSGILTGIGAVITTNEFLLAVLSLVGALFMAPVSVYMYSTFAGFYEILARHLVKETEPVAPTPELVQIIDEATDILDEKEPDTAETEVEADVEPKVETEGETKGENHGEERKL